MKNITGVERLLLGASLLVVLSIGGYLTLLWPSFGWLCLIAAGACVVLAVVLALVIIILNVDISDEDGSYPGS